MRKKENRLKTAAFVLSAGVFFGVCPSIVLADEPGEWREENGSLYWYENGIKQGTEGRGKEIYDPASDGWYWLDAIDGGKKAVGKDVYQESWAGSYADHEDGTGKWVRYDTSGKMVKGWDVTERGAYYFDQTTGAMAKGETEIDGIPCIFDRETGIGWNLQWQEKEGARYWYEGGKRQGLEGRGKEIYDPASDAWYWLDSDAQGKMAVNKDVYQPYTIQGQDETGKWVRYDADGHMVKGWDRQNESTYYFDQTTGAMAKGVAKIDGVSYYFNETTGVCEGEYTPSDSSEPTNVTTYTANDQVSEYTENELDASGNVVKSTTYSASGVKKTERTDAFDQYGNQIRGTYVIYRGGEVYSTATDETVYEYNADGQPLSMTCYNDSQMFSRVLYTYDNGKTAKVEYYVPLDGEEELSNYEQYFYENGRCVRKENYVLSYTDGAWNISLDTSDYYAYNSNGNLIRETNKSARGNVNYYYTYDYDASGNLIAKGCYAKDDSQQWKEVWTYEGMLLVSDYYYSEEALEYYIIYENRQRSGHLYQKIEKSYAGDGTYSGKRVYTYEG